MRHKGVTLIELLVALCLTAIVTTMLVQLMAAGHRSWSRSSQRSSTLENALLVVTRVREEVRSANPDATVYLPFAGTDANGLPVSYDALLLVSWQAPGLTELQWDPTGQILWQSVVAIYLDQGTHRVLVRYRLLPSATVDPPTLSATDFAPLPDDQIHVLAQHVHSLSFTSGGPTVVNFQVQAGASQNDCQLDGSAMTTVPSVGQASPGPLPSLSPLLP